MERDAKAADTDGERSPRLVLSFAARAALVLAVAALGVLWFVRDEATRRSESAVGFHAGFVANTILRDQLTGAVGSTGRSLLGSAATPASRSRIDHLLRNEVLVGGAVRANLYDGAGRLVYSTAEKSRFAAAASVRRALAGRTSTSIVTLTGSGKALAAFTPIKDVHGVTVGAFELDQDYAPVARDARAVYIPVGLAFAVALLLLYAVLFPILRRLIRRLRRQLEVTEHQALHDILTELPNRRLFQLQVEQGIRAERRLARGLAVLLIDLDRFKEINDALGHASGDELLRQVAARLRTALRESDLVARLGGDEFAVLAAGVTSPDQALEVAARIRTALAAPIVIADISLDVQCSIGISCWPQHGRDMAELLRLADVALYLSKERRTGVEIYTPGEDTHTPERLALASDLGRAIERSELSLVYQPKLELATGRLVGVEALMRWNRGGESLVPPDEFIPLAEHTGLIRPLTSWALQEAIGQARRWLDDDCPVPVAVNLSARDIIDLRLPDEIKELLRRNDVDASLLELEITESAILADPDRAQAVLQRLSDLGVRLAIDDFGKGYTSLSYLKRLPISVLKIDNSFVRGMVTCREDEAIVRSMIELGRNLGLEVVAEGIETAEVADALRALRCDLGQGYHYGRPVAAEQISPANRPRRPVHHGRAVRLSR